MAAIPVTRSNVRVESDPLRRIAKPFLPGGDNPDDGRTRIEHILDRVLAMPAHDAARTLAHVRDQFTDRHEDLDAVLLATFDVVAQWIEDPSGLPADMRSLIGAYFTHEYSIETAALTNPSIVAAPDQAGVPDGWIRIVMSVRAIGEGHISCIEFRTGLVGPGGQVSLDPILPPILGERQVPVFDKRLFATKLDEIDAGDGLVPQVLSRLGDPFTMAQLDDALSDLHQRGFSGQMAHHAVQAMHWLASSNYELAFPPASAISQRMIFPAGPTESRGMEDARLVRFQDSDGSVVYYATYTAYDGFTVLPQLIETTDFVTFKIATLNGPAVRNKGMTIFPRKVGARYAALARSDNESTYVMFSDHVRFWRTSERIQVPTMPWELVQIGNCGAPIETDAGWLVITHGVGPMRSYVLGALLLDLEDPRRVIGHLPEPLLAPDETERDGYVPNVVYSCGSLIHDGTLVIAYGASDTSARFATVSVERLLGELTRPRSASSRV